MFTRQTVELALDLAEARAKLRHAETLACDLDPNLTFAIKAALHRTESAREQALALRSRPARPFALR